MRSWPYDRWGGTGCTRRLSWRGDDTPEEAEHMARQDILSEITQAFGAVPEWLSGIPAPQLEHQWGLLRWVLSDSALSARDKALVAFGAAGAVHCPY